jgi:peptide/nickel transport system permease protein
MTILGTFKGVGYLVEGIQEISFTPYYNYGYADAVFAVNMTFNPLLYPFQWLIGEGIISKNISMTYLPHAYERGEWGPPIFGGSEEHYANYISYVVSSATFANILILLVLTIAIELLQWRVSYISLFAGLLGFLVMSINGMLIGLIIGFVLAMHIAKSKYKLSLVGVRGYVLKRIIYSFALVILVITIDFVIFMKMPSNPMDLFARWTRTESEAETIRKLWGLNQPLIPQYLTYMRNLLSFNLGNLGRTLTDPTSKKVIPVAESLLTRLPYTVFLLGTSTLISIVIGVMIGCFTIYKRGKLVDMVSAVFPSTLSSLPVQWLGAILLLIFSLQLGWFPFEGAFPEQEWKLNPPTVFNSQVSCSQAAINVSVNFNILELWRLVFGYSQHALLPILTLVISQVGMWILLTRASLIETVGEPYLITAKAKGITDWKAITRHALRNASLPILTSAALSFGFIVSGSVIIERVFRYPGIGLWLFDSVQNMDFVVLMTVFYVISLCVIIANVVADILYGILDPRIKTS